MTASGERPLAGRDPGQARRAGGWRSTSTTAPRFRCRPSCCGSRARRPRCRATRRRQKVTVGGKREVGITRARAGRQLRRADHLRRRPQHRHLLLALPPPARPRPGPRSGSAYLDGAGGARASRARGCASGGCGMTAHDLRLLHTADWQLGKPFHNLPARWRRSCARRGSMPCARSPRWRREHEVDGRAGRRGRVRRQPRARARDRCQALAAMRGFAGPWVLLPGNHDAALAEGVWSRLRAAGPPGQRQLATAPEPIALADGRLVVLPAPLTERHTTDDLTAWMDARGDAVGGGAGRPRPRLGRRPPAGRRPTPRTRSTAERAERARLDYLALGDWHGTLEIAPAHLVRRHARARSLPRQRRRATCCWSSWTGRAHRPAVTRLPTGAPSLAPAELDLTGATDARGRPLEQALRRELGDRSDGHRQLVQLRLHGCLGMAQRAELEAALEPLAGELCHLEVEDSELAAEPSERGPEALLRRCRRRSVVAARRLRELRRRAGRGRGGRRPGAAPALSARRVRSRPVDEAAPDRDRASSASSTGPVVLDGLADRLIVVSGDNEEGKSTVLAALKAAFFEHHTVGGAVREAMTPHRGGMPEIARRVRDRGRPLPPAQGVPPGRREPEGAGGHLAGRRCRAPPAGAAPVRSPPGPLRARGPQSRPAGAVLGRPGHQLRVPRSRRARSRGTGPRSHRGCDRGRDRQRCRRRGRSRAAGAGQDAGQTVLDRGTAAGDRRAGARHRAGAELEREIEPLRARFREAEERVERLARLRGERRRALADDELGQARRHAQEMQGRLAGIEQLEGECQRARDRLRAVVAETAQLEQRQKARRRAAPRTCRAGAAADSTPGQAGQDG